MTAATVTRWSRAFVAFGVASFVAWHLAVVAGYPRAATLSLGLRGFVFGVLFGKAYALLPSYFARELAVPRAPAAHLPLAAFGVLGDFAGAVGVGPAWVGRIGAVAWFLGCLVFVAALGWTVRDNPTGGETGTAGANVHRERVDRVANLAVPVALGYLLAGASGPLLEAAGFAPPGLPSSGPPASHLLAAGTAALLVLGVGFRLLPRFLVVAPRRWLVALALPTGALAPALLAVDFRGAGPFRVGAILQALAVVAFAVAVGDMYRRSDRRRVGFYGVLSGAVAGVLLVVLGLSFAFPGALPVGGLEAGAITAHYRLAVGGFLGLTIVGVSFQFYPPAIARVPGIGDRTALVAIGALAAGLGVEVLGHLGDAPTVATLGALIGLFGALCYAAIVFAVFVDRW